MPGRRGFAPSVHRICEKTEIQGFTAASQSNTAGILTFSLAQLLNLPSLKNLWDLYKITGVKITLMPQWNTSQIGQSSGGVPGNTSGLPILAIAPNRSPYSTTPTSLNDVMNDDYCRIIRLTRPVSMYLKYPKPVFLDKDQNVQNSALFNDNIQPWLSTGGNAQTIDQSNVAHYGFKYFLDNANFAGNATVRVFVKLYVKLKEQD